MPTLIRLVITVLFLVGLVYAGMFALIAYVQPTPKEVTIRIPASELLKASAPERLPVVTRKPIASVQSSGEQSPSDQTQ